MNKSKLGIIILLVLLVGVLAFAGYSTMENQKLMKESQSLEQQLTKAQSREKKNVAEIKDLKDKIKKTENEKFQLEKQVKKIEKQSEELYAQVSELTDDRDKWKSRMEEIRNERDKLLAKVQELSKPTVVVQRESPTATKDEETPPGVPTIRPPTQSITVKGGNEEYWASVVKEKAAIEVELAKLKEEFSKNAIEVVEIKKKNADLQIKLDALKNEKEEIEHNISYKEEMIDNLSIELARARNDKKYESDRVAKLNDENKQLRDQVKQLVTTKSALEKSIVRLNQEKTNLEKEIGQTESLIQSKIDEIWEIKDSLDQTIKTSVKTSQPEDEVELPPIIVSTDKPAVEFDAGMSRPGLDGKVVSINKGNNFIIVDVGESAGVRLGDILSVYRDQKYIARVEVIQVRKDIAAADIKDQWSKVKIGDKIR